MSEITNKIINSLNEIEKEKDVKIIYACESGSRAWGFPSTDSDYDVRFIYLHRPDWYLSLGKLHDVIEKPIIDELDVNGWDLSKALKLFRKSNPPLSEWLGSPTVYLDEYSIANKMRELAYKYYSQNACTYHYLHMAVGNSKEYLRGDIVWVKKYFYVLRPLMAIIWMEQGRGLVPTDFNIIVKELDIQEFLRKAINKLIEQKKNGDELRHGPRNEILSSFIETELERLSEQKPSYPRPIAPVEPLNRLFIEAINEVWPGYLGAQLIA